MKEARVVLKSQHKTQWWVYHLPCGGVRHLLLGTPRGCVLLQNGIPKEMTATLRRPRHEGVPSDTVLDVVLLENELRVVDAYCLPGDLDLWTKPFRVRKDRISIFINSIRGGGAACLTHKAPMTLSAFVTEKPRADAEQLKSLFLYADCAKRPTPSLEFEFGGVGRPSSERRNGSEHQSHIAHLWGELLESVSDVER
uniref:Uncharacterized protein n=2 Tax=Lotharella globosa TaxID=91324 RepID=A0A7S3Z1A5_9EUKA